MNKDRLFLFGCVVAIIGIVSGCASKGPIKTATEYSSAEEYLSVPFYQDEMETYRKRGIISGMRDKAEKGCDDSKKKIVGFCDCLKGKYSSITDEQLYFDFKKIMDFQERGMVAIRNNDTGKRDQLIERMMNETRSFKAAAECEAELKK